MSGPFEPILGLKEFGSFVLPSPRGRSKLLHWVRAKGGYVEKLKVPLLGLVLVGAAVGMMWESSRSGSGGASSSGVQVIYFGRSG